MSGLHFLALALLACAPVVGPSSTSPQHGAPPPPPPPPVATAGETIELPPAPPATTATGPARVLHHSPEGAADFSSEIAVLFDGPVRPLGLAPNDPPITATISPQVAGRWSWVGTDAIRFEPREPLPGATRFEVSIPRELPALPGRAMAEPHRFAFETPRPRVVAATPDADLESDYRYPQERDVAFELSFNQKVDRAVADHLSLTATTTSGERSLRFRVDVSDGARKVVVVPSAPLPPGATVVLKADEGLTGSEGPMPMGVSFTHAIAVKGPIRPVAARCTPSHFDAELCDPRGPIRLYFSGDAPYSYEGLDFVRTQPAKKSWGQDSGIEGGRGFVDVTLSDVAAGESLELTVEAPPGKRIDNAWEEPLVGALRTRLRFGRPRPSLDLWGSGVHHPASSPLAMVLSATNVELIRVRAARPTRAQILAMVREPEVPPALHFGAMRSLATPRPDEDVQHQVALSDLVGDARGPVVVEVLHREPGPNGEVEQRTRKAVQLTELGVHTTLLHRHVLVWVTGLTSGAALAKAEVEVRRLDGAVVGRGVTGKDGTVRLPLAATAGGEGDEGERYVVFVRRGDDFAYHEARRPPPGGTLGIAYSDRGLYRPGETVELAGVIRVPGAGASLETPRGKRGQLVVRDPHGRVFRRLELSTSTFGTWHRSLVLSEAAVRGIYRVEVWLGGPEDRPPHVVPGRFVVADYEPTPFTVDATILPLRSPPVVRGEDIRCVATGRYLHGSPMAGATAALEIRRERETFAPEGLRLFHTTLERRPEPPRRHARGAGTLDGEGRFEHRVTLDLPEMTGPERVRCEILGSDLDGRALEAQDSVIVHPASAYVGIRVEQEVFRGKPFTVQVRATDIAGTNLSLPVDVVVERFEEREGEVEREVVGRCHVATSEATAHCDFEAPDRPYAAADEGLEIRATSADPEGRPIAASFSIYPEPEPEHTTPSPSPPQPIGRSFTLSGEVFDRPVTPGEVMRVWISSPWIKDGEVQLTAFRDDVIWRKRLRLPPRGAIVDIPITDAMVPTVALHAVAVSGSKGASDEREIEVSSASRELKVSLTPSATEVLPGAPLDIDLVVKDAAGRPVQAEVTLYAADVATLYLAQYRRPDPMRIYASRWIRYDDYDSREHLFDPRRSHRSRPPRVRMGASHVSFDVRGDFRQTAFYLPHLVTGSDGRLRRRVTLPDGLTTYRIFAVAVTAGEQVGGAEAEVQTNKPVMLQPSVPRVLRSGDRTAIHATLQGEARGPVTVTVEAGGALRLRGETKKTVRLSGPEAIGVTFEAEATAAGPYQVLFAASAPGGEDRVVARGEVVAPTLTETADLSGVTDRAVLEQLGDLDGARPDVGGLTVTMASSPLIALQGALEASLDYPYGCTEQTVSRLLPFIALDRIGPELGLEGADRQVIAGAVERLANHQRADGGFGFWPRSRASLPWLSAYATWALTRAGEGAAPIIARARPYLLTQIDDAFATPDGPLRPQALASAAFAVDTFATLGTPLWGAAARLYAERAALPPHGRALLVHALAESDEGAPAWRGEAIATLLDELTHDLVLSGDAAYLEPAPGPEGMLTLSSRARDTALALRGILRAAANDPLAHKLAQGLIHTLADPSTTHDDAWALVALDAYRAAHPLGDVAFAARLYLDDRPLTQVRFGPDAPKEQQIEIPMAQLRSGSRLVLGVAGEGELHYRAALRFARSDAAPPITQGISLHKSVEWVDPFVASGVRAVKRAPRVGDLLRVDITLVTSATRRFVALDDPLAAGLRAIDPSLQGGPDGVSEVDREVPWDHRELRDDRVLFFVDHLDPGIHRFSYYARVRHAGDYSVPPTQAQEMYAPAVRGTTAATRVHFDPR